ncbi:MAG: NAD-dependent epimerase/dehydratase family protein [Thermomicrobiales bacterium]
MSNGVKQRVLVTGAGGRIGGHLAESLRDRFDLRLQYRNTMPEIPPVSDWAKADIAEFDEILPLLEGIDAVVHMAGEPSTSGTWEEVHRQNIVGMYNVLEAARVQGVKRVIFASTNHVMGMYDRDGSWPIYASMPVRPDSLYGVSKAFGENLGRYYYDTHGLSVICLRIGWFLDHPHDDFARWCWLSPRDCTQIVAKSIESDLGFEVFYAISGNGQRKWDITDTMVKLGYIPEDDGERFFTDEE